MFEDPPPPSILPYIGGGIALIGGAGATIFFLDARRARHDANLHYTTDPAFASDRSRFMLERGVGFALTGVGAIGLGLAIYGWLRHDRREPPVAVNIGLGGAMVSAGRAF